MTSRLGGDGPSGLDEQAPKLSEEAPRLGKENPEVGQEGPQSKAKRLPAGNNGASKQRGRQIPRT